MQPLTIDLVSDVVCPWCFIGKRHLEAALAQCDLPVSIRWLPYFLKTELRYDDGTAGYVSIALEAGGVLGAVGVGALADRLPTGSRARLAAPLLFALAGACLLLRSFAHSGVPANLLTLGLCGFLLIGPDSLISAAAAQDLGGDRATGTVSGLINSFGSLGAILQGSLTVVITTRLGWSALFHLFVVIALLSGTLLLLPAARRSRQAPYP